MLRIWDQLCFRLDSGTEYVALTSTNAPAGASPPSFGSPRGTNLNLTDMVGTEGLPSMT